MAEEEFIIRSPLAPVDIPEEGLWDYLNTIFQDHGNKPALTDILTETCTTYKELKAAVENVASNLVSIHSLKPGDRFAFCSFNSCQFVVLELALWRIGAVPVLINCFLPPGEIKRQLKMTQSRYIFTQQPLIEKVLQSTGDSDSTVQKIFLLGNDQECVPFTSLLEPNHGDHASRYQLPDPKDSTAAILFSSGITGPPKGVMLTHYNIVACIQQLLHPAMESTEDTILAYQPMFHIMSQSLLLTALKQGSHALVIPKFDMDLYLGLVSKHKIKQMLLSPSLISVLCKTPLREKYDLSHLQHIGYGGCPLSKEVQNEVHNVFSTNVCIRTGYGLTECSGGVCSLLGNDNFYSKKQLKDDSSIGILAPNTEAKVVDLDTNESLGPDKVGELYIRSPQVFKGYVAESNMTTECPDSQGWLHTGDVCYYDDNGYIYLVDRLKEMIKYKSFQLAPSQIDDILVSMSDIVDAGTVGIPDSACGEIPVACVVRKPESTLSEEDIASYVNERVVTIYQLQSGSGVRFVPAIPRAPTGKILRQVLRGQVLKLISTPGGNVNEK